MEMVKMFSLLLCLLAVFCDQAYCKCPKLPTTNTTSGTIDMPSGLVKGDACTFVITRIDKASKFSMLSLNAIKISEKDTFVLYDGPAQQENILFNITGDQVVSQVGIAFQENVTIVFTVGEDPVASSWAVAFNTKECVQTLDNTQGLRVEAPVYLSNKGDLECTYTVEQKLSEGFRPVVQVPEISLLKGSMLTLSSGPDHNVTYAGPNALLPEDFFPTLAENTSVHFKLVSGSEQQGFSLVFQSFAEDCSYEAEINGSYTLNLVLPEVPPVNYQCKLRLRLMGDTTTGAIMASVMSLSLLEPSDVLTLQDGDSSAASILASLTSTVSDYISLSSSTSVLMSLTLGVGKADRTVNIKFSHIEQGGRLTEAGKLTAGKVEEADGVTTSVMFQLVAAEGQLVNVQLITPLTGNSTLTFYDGQQSSDQVLAVLGPTSQDLKRVIGNSNMLVALSNFPMTDNFTAVFTSIPVGCDQLLTEASGRVEYSEEKVNATQTCTLTFAPVSLAGTIVLDVETFNLGDGDSVMLYSGLTGSKVVMEAKGPKAPTSLPQINVPGNARLVVTRTKIYRADTKLAIRYKVVPQVCGDKLEAAEGMVSTPNYPNQYPLNSACEWTVVKPNSSLYLNFQSLNLAPGHALTLSDTVNKTSHVLATYGGVSAIPSLLPADLIVPVTAGLNLQFSSAAPKANNTQVGGGAMVHYWLLECGGNISKAAGTFQTPGYPKAPTKSLLCVWIIQLAVPAKNTTANIVEFKITTKGDNVNQYLSVYDGNSMRSAKLATSGDKALLSRYNSIVIIFDYTKKAQAGNEDLGVNITYRTHTCNSSSMCKNGICMHDDWRCNQIDDCGDNSDEQNCVFPPSTPAPQSYSGWVKSGWVPACLFIGVILGAVLIFIIPRIVRRIRGSGGNYSRMNDPVA